MSKYSDFIPNSIGTLILLENQSLGYSQHERESSRSLVPSAMKMGLAAVVVATAIVLLTANITLTNAQQPTTQPAEVITQNGTTTLFESAEDSFRLQVPQGWVIQDVNNTGFTLATEVMAGYVILAELCPEDEEEGDGGGRTGGQQEEQALGNVNSSSTSNSSSRRSCQQLQQPQEEIIHIIRYPNLDSRFQFALGITDNNNNNTTENILSYHVQKLQEVGYRNIEIVNNRETTVNLTNAQTNETVSTVPAKTVDITYVTNFAPDETRTGYFILTATNATAPIPGTMKGYSVFYEGKSTATAATNGASILQTTTSDNLPSPLSAQVRQIFDSFELIAAEEGVAQTGDGGDEFDTGENDTGENGTGEFNAGDFDTGDGGGGDFDTGDGGGDEFDTGENDTGEFNAGDFDTGDGGGGDFDTGDGGGGDFDTGDGGGDEFDTGDFDTGDGGGGDFDTGDGGEEEKPTNPLTVDIISNGTEGIAPATFEFQADITGGTEPYSISWDFDDDDGSREENEDDEQGIVHTFDEAGIYNVTLSITDSEDLTASDSMEITVEEQQLSPIEEEQEEAMCDSSYPDVCIPAPPPDLDCGDHGVPENFQVLRPDPHRFDSDNDGIGCDSKSNQAELEPEESSPNDDSSTTSDGTNPNDDGDNNAIADDDEEDA